MRKTSEKKSIEIQIRRVCTGTKKMVCRSTPHGANHRMHWRKKYEWDKAWKEQVYWLIREQGHFVEPFKYARIEIELRTIRPQDKDNSYFSIKPVLDATKGLVIVDDDPEHLDLSVRSIKVNRRSDEGVRMRIEEL